MRVAKFRILDSVAINLAELMRDGVRRAELEERLKRELFKEMQHLNSEDYKLEMVYNKIANSFDIIIKKLEDVTL